MSPGDPAPIPRTRDATVRLLARAGHAASKNELLWLVRLDSGAPIQAVAHRDLAKAEVVEIDLDGRLAT